MICRYLQGERVFGCGIHTRYKYTYIYCIGVGYKVEEYSVVGYKVEDWIYGSGMHCGIYTTMQNIVLYCVSCMYEKLN